MTVPGDAAAPAAPEAKAASPVVAPGAAKAQVQQQPAGNEKQQKVAEPAQQKPAEPAQQKPAEPAQQKHAEPEPKKVAEPAEQKVAEPSQPPQQQGVADPAQALKFDFEAAEDFMDLEEPAAAAPEPAAKRRRKQDNETPAATKAKEARLCAVCESEPCVPKFTYCKECKKDVQSCLNNAKAEGKEEDFRRLTKTAAGLKHLLSHYKSKCPSRGQGVPRDSMNWVAYLKVAYNEKRVIDGSREVFMDFPDFEIHMKGKGKTAIEIMNEWADMEARNVDHDFKGRKDFEKRFAIAVEDYRLKEQVRGDREDWIDLIVLFSFQGLVFTCFNIEHFFKNPS